MPVPALPLILPPSIKREATPPVTVDASLVPLPQICPDRVATSDTTADSAEITPKAIPTSPAVTVDQIASVIQIESENKRLQKELEIQKQHMIKLTADLVSAQLKLEASPEQVEQSSGEDNAQKRIVELETALAAASAKGKNQNKAIDDLTLKLNTVTIDCDVAKDQHREAKRSLATRNTELSRVQGQYAQIIKELGAVSEARDLFAAEHKTVMESLHAAENSVEELKRQFQQRLDDVLAALKNKASTAAEAAER